MLRSVPNCLLSDFLHIPHSTHCGNFKDPPHYYGHILIVLIWSAPLLSDLTEEEYQDLWGSERKIQRKFAAAVR